jgi:hypothetical protein
MHHYSIYKYLNIQNPLVTVLLQTKNNRILKLLLDVASSDVREQQPRTIRNILRGTETQGGVHLRTVAAVHGFQGQAAVDHQGTAEVKAGIGGGRE